MLEEAAHYEGAFSAAPSKGLSRRQLVKAGVWAAPVVVLATASPAAATSGQLSAGNAPGFPAVNGNQITVSVTATPGTSVTVTGVMTVSPADGSWQDATGAAGSRTTTATTTGTSSATLTFPVYKKKSNNVTYTWTVLLTAPGYPNQTLTGTW